MLTCKWQDSGLYSLTEWGTSDIDVDMYIATVPNRGSPPAILLREGYREGGTVKNRTLANLTKWPAQKVDLFRRLLRDEPLAPVDTLFEVVASAHHGHVQAVRATMQRLGFDTLIAARPSRERALVVAMVAARILEPDSKLATTGGGTPRRCPWTSASATPTRTRSTKRWIGCSRGKTASSRSWPRATSGPAGSSSTT